MLNTKFVRAFFVITLLMGFINIKAQNVSDNKSAVNLLELNKPLERELKGQEIHNYTIPLKAGDFLQMAVDQRGIDVVVRVFAPGGDKLAEIDSLNGKNGIEPINLEVKAAGTYKIEIASLDKNSQPGRYEAKVTEILSAEQYAKLLAEKRIKKQAVIKWLADNAIPLKTVEAGNGFKDLQPLKKVLKDAQIVGLGEATHGTREFFQFKNRMLEFLVKEMGFRVFTMELDYVDGLNINDFVMGKTTTDSASLLNSARAQVWNTEEVRTLIDWMKTYNASVPEDKKVKFVGFDCQDREKGKARLLDYLQGVAPERVAKTDEFFKNTTYPSKLDKDKSQELQSKYVDLFLFFEQDGVALINKSNKTEYEQMREIARTLVQPAYVYPTDDSNSGSRRDTCMAENFRRAVDREPSGTKFVLWAHNDHVRSESNAFFQPMGNHLRRFYGNRYYAMDFTFNQGAFEAWDKPSSNAGKLIRKSFMLNPAPENSLDWYLAQTNLKEFIVDFRTIGKNENLSKWLAEPRLSRSIGWSYDSNREKSSFTVTVPQQSFDGVFFINTTTASKPTQGMKEKYMKE